jgi:ERCC4-type nuclease
VVSAVCPFTVVIDTREQHPYTFEDITAAGRPVEVTTITAGLKSGDYSIQGHESEVAVERKSLQDLYSTLTAGRERFERELQRLQDLAVSVVIVEASWHEIADPAFPTRANPASVTGSILAMQQRFPRTHWLPAGSRPMAEAATYGILRRYWIDNVEKPRKTLDPRREALSRGDGGKSDLYTAN